MISTLTIDQVRAAQANDLDATTAVIEATQSRISRLAEKAARQLVPAGGDGYMSAREEFEQDGRIAVWESLNRFNGDTVDNFFGFVYSTVEAALLDSVRQKRNGATGVDADAVKIFGAMLEMSDGDVYLAEKLAQSVPPKGRRLSADRANAARMAWQGTHSLDAPSVTMDGPMAGNVSQNDYSISLGALVASTYGVPEDLVSAADLTAEESRVKHAVITGILDVMGQNQRDVIRHSFGIGGATFYGHGASGDDEGLAAELGLTVAQVRPARSKGLKTFAKRYVAYVASTNPAEAAQLEEAAAQNLSAGGRK